MSQSNLISSQNALSTTAEIIFAANSGVTRRIIKNSDASISVAIGTADTVTTSNGFLLKAGEQVIIEGYNGILYAIAASGTPSVSLIEY